MSRVLPKIDVVIPCYNEQDEIGACLDALFHQGDDITRIILIDNNSTDNTWKIMQDYAAKNTKISCLQERKQGVIPARNTGLDAATAEIICRIDADTMVKPGWARAFREYYAANPQVNIATGRFRQYDLPFLNIAGRVTDLFTHIANRKLAQSPLSCGANMSLRRSAWHLVRDEVCNLAGIMEDQDLAYHIELHGAKNGYVHDAYAEISGRRMRMSPLRYWRYNKMWWHTYAIHGQKHEARRIRVVAWVGNVLQAAAWFVLLAHDPRRNRFSFKYIFSKKTERAIPWGKQDS